MEAFAILAGLLIIIAFGLALVGVPVLLSRVKVLTLRVQLLDVKVAALESTTTQRNAPTTQGKITATSMAEVPFVVQEEQKFDVEPVSQSIKSDIPAFEQESIKATVAPVEPAQRPKTQWSSIDRVVVPESVAVTMPHESRSSTPSLWTTLLNRLLAMNITAQVGGIVLIFGAIFLGKYASDIGVLTLQAKLILMAVISVALIAAGSVFQSRLSVYANVLQGTGFAGWLVTLFVAHVLYEQLHWLVTLIAGVAGVVFIGFRSLKQNSQPLAMVAFLGGFLTPFIASSEVSSLWRLFAYLSVLNVAVVCTAYFKPWRWLVREAYGASFGLLTLLMIAEYLQHDLDRLSTQLPMAMFVGLTLLSFSALAWRWLATAQLVFIKHASGLLFGVPAAATLALQALFHQHSIYVSIGLAAAALWYAVIFYFSHLKTFLVIAVVMASAAVPYALSDSLTSLVYSIEGCAFAYWAIRFSRRSALAWGVGLQVLAAVFVVKLFQSVEMRDTQLVVSWILNGAIAIAALLTAWWFKQYQQPMRAWVKQFEMLALFWALTVWLFQWGFWLAETFSRQYTLWYMAGVLAASVVVVYMVAQRLRWTLLGKGAGVLSVIFIGTGLLFLADYADTASGLKMLLLVTLSIAVFALRLYHAITKAPLANWDALASWVGLPFIASVALYFVPTLQTDWNLILLMVVPLLQALFMRKGLTLLFSPSPVRRFARWLTLAALFLLSLMTLSRLGNYAPLPFWPLVHPLTIVCIVAAEPLFRYVRRHRVLRLVWVMWLGAAVTVELNRWLFHYAGIPFDVDAWLESALTQTVWSIVWTLIGGALMITAARLNHSRSRWMVGAIVLGLIVLKLFVLDLVQVDTLYRILSFLGVGGLLLGIGYFAPMPGAKTQQPTPVDHSEDSAVKRN